MFSAFSYIRARISIFRIPDGAPPQLRTAYRMLWPVAATLWPAGVTGIWDMSTRGLLVTLAGAAVSTRLLFGCWGAAMKYDDDLRAVSLAAADAIRRLPDDQRRELLVRSAD